MEHSINAIFTYTYHTKLLNLWPNSLSSHVVTYSWLSACQRKREPFKDHQITCKCLTSHSKKSLGKLPYQYLPELLVNVYSYRLMDKSVPCLCVCKVDFLKYNFYNIHIQCSGYYANSYINQNSFFSGTIECKAIEA